MVSELLRHSDRPEVRDRLKPHLRLCHRPKEVTRDDAPVALLISAFAKDNALRKSPSPNSSCSTISG